ncbi:MAG: TraB/GumN family protein [Chitinophagales bacterium]
MFCKEKKTRLLPFAFIWLLLTQPLQAQYQSLLWQISGPGIKQPSFLYGTMHTADSRVFHFSKAVEPAFKNSKAFAMELDPSSQLAADVIVKLMMDEKHSLHQLLADSDYHFLDSLMLKKSGMGLAMYDKMSPIVITALLEQIAMSADEGERVSEERDFLDMYFYRRAKKMRKKIIGIEEVQDQLKALNSLTYEEQALLLHEELDQARKDKKEGANVLELYVAQDLDGLLRESDEMKMPPKFYYAMITARNAHMAERMAVLVLEKPTFIAVGALHLPGEEGVINLLRKKGFAVNPVKP